MKVFLDTIGCRLNQAEIEEYARQFRSAGHEIVADAQDAELAVINTCTVTSAADSDSRSKVRLAVRAGVNEVLVTGCWATMRAGEAAALPGVSRVVPNAVKERLVPELLHLPSEDFNLEPIERQPIPGARLRTRAFIKVQDGCNNRCSFCVTTLARGLERSRPTPDILADVRSAATTAKEIVLTGVHLGSWGKDLTNTLRLRHLIQSILQETDVVRLRLSSVEPWDLEKDFFSLWEDKRLCRHLHLPLQSGCEATLRRMGRKITPEMYAKLVAAARDAIPGIAITTDIITGFPGEDESEFKESMDFVQTMDFAGGHVFTYSPRPGTAAASMQNQVPHAVRKERNAAMRALFDTSAYTYRSKFLGQTLAVLWESVVSRNPHDWELSGLTDNFMRVYARGHRELRNQLSWVKIASIREGRILGLI